MAIPTDKTRREFMAAMAAAYPAAALQFPRLLDMVPPGRSVELEFAPIEFVPVEQPEIQLVTRYVHKVVPLNYIVREDEDGIWLEPKA